MTISFGRLTAGDGTRIFTAYEPGSGVPLVAADEPAYAPVQAQLLTQDIEFTRGLAGGAPWYLFDWRAKGASSGNAEDISFDGLVDDLAAVVAKAGSWCDVYALGRACPVALAFAAREPRQVRRLLLASARAEESPQSRPDATDFLSAAAIDRTMAMRTYLRAIQETGDMNTLMSAAEAWDAGVTPGYFKAIEAVMRGRDLAGAGHSESVSTLLLAMGPFELPFALEACARLPGSTVAEVASGRTSRAMGVAWRTTWDEHCPPTTIAPQATPALTAREHEVLALTCGGLSNAEIGERLVIAIPTVKRHLSNIFAKLGVTTRAQAIAAAVHARGIDRLPGSDGR